MIILLLEYVNKIMVSEVKNTLKSPKILSILRKSITFLFLNFLRWRIYTCRRYAGTCLQRRILRVANFQESIFSILILISTAELNLFQSIIFGENFTAGLQPVNL